MFRWSLVLAYIFLAGCAAGESPDEASVVEAMRRQFDKPEARLEVGPLAVAGDSALADWTQGEMGGRALLKRHGDEWRIELCAGDSIKNETTLAMSGMSKEHARMILAELEAEERQASPDRLRRIAAFRGVVRLGEGAHSPDHPAPDHPAPAH